MEILTEFLALHLIQSHSRNNGFLNNLEKRLLVNKNTIEHICNIFSQSSVCGQGRHNELDTNIIVLSEEELFNCLVLPYGCQINNFK